jgi:hypothetical protein
VRGQRSKSILDAHDPHKEDGGIPIRGNMNVSAWSDGTTTYGIRIGKRNRAAYFQSSWSEIELELDGRFHRIPLSAGFWNKCPEFRSPLIREWLTRHGLLDWPEKAPPKFELVPLGKNRFRLSALPAPTRK